MPSRATAIFLLVLVAACQPRQPEGWVDPTTMENDVTAAVVRHLIQESSAKMGVEAPYCVVIGEVVPFREPTGASRIFADRFQDTGKKFVLAKELTFDRGTKATVIRGALTIPYLLQLRRMEKKDEDTYEVDAAWNYRADIAARTFAVKGKVGSSEALRVEVVKTEREEHPPPPPTLPGADKPAGAP